MSYRASAVHFHVLLTPLPSGDAPDVLTVGERLMLAVMNELTDEVGWERRILDLSFVEDWEAEVLSRYPDLTFRMVEWVG